MSSFFSLLDQAYPWYNRAMRLDKLLGNAVFLCYSGNRVILARILEDNKCLEITFKRYLIMIQGDLH